MNQVLNKVAIDDVMKHFAAGFTAVNGQKIEAIDWFVDHRRGEVLFVVQLEDEVPRVQVAN